MRIRPWLRTAALVLPSWIAATMAASAPAQDLRYRDRVFQAVDVTMDVAYGSAVNRFTNQTETLRLDLYRPRGDTAPERPAVVVVHGGGFHGGDKGTTQLRDLCTDLARRGYVAVSINYRLKPRSAPVTQQVVTDAAHDFKASVRWLRRFAGVNRVDPDRIGCLGSSAGAFTVCEGAAVPGEGTSGNPGFSSDVAVVVDLWGGLLDETQLDAGDPPLLIVHGTNDATVPYSRATTLKARADAVGVPAELLPLQGAGHAPWTLYNQTVHVQVVVPTLWRWLEVDRLAGLDARPGWATSGTLELDATGEAGDTLILVASPRAAVLPLPPLGTVLIDPFAAVLVPPRTLASTPRLPLTTWSYPVPSGSGTVHWQVLRVQGTTPLSLTNAIETPY